MVRRAVYFISAICFVLLIGCAGGWVRSYIALDEYRYGAAGSEREDASPQYVLASGKGKVQWLRCEAQSAKEVPLGLRSKSAEDLFSLSADQPVDRRWGALGVEYFDRPRYEYSQASTSFRLWAFRYLTVPYWALCVVFAVMSWPAVKGVARRLRKRRRVRKGLCGVCGYNLRGNTSGRCSECGSVTSAGTS